MEFCFWTLLIGALFVSLFFYYRKNRHDFKDWGIPQPKEWPFLGIVGMNIIRRLHISKMMKEIYNLNKDAKYIGMHSFMTPVVIVRDLDLVKTVLVKDFDYFADHVNSLDASMDPLLSNNLVSLNGDEWRKVRNLLTPAFTSSKMKAMFELMTNYAEDFVDSFIKQCENEDETNMKDAFTKYTNDVIATCAFGIEINSIKNPTNEFYVYGKQVTKTEGFAQIKQMLKMILIMKLPFIARFFQIRLIPENVSNFFVNVIDATIKTRDEKGITRPDMLQLLMDARKKGDDNLKLDIINMTAQAFLFFIAGFDTAATHMSLMAHEIAINPDVQEKLHAEIDAVSKATNNKPTYEAISNMPYLDAIFQETLRKHPILAVLSRNCSKPYELPPALPNAKPYPIKPDDLVMIPVTGIHQDPNIYEKPMDFIPERFLNKKITSFDVTSLGFGLGPRMCIGNRFAILEIKVLFFYLLKRCTLAPCEKTCIPLKYSLMEIGPTPKNGFWLRLKER